MRRILAVLLLLVLLCGCTGQMIPAGENRLTFYYRRADGADEARYGSETGALAEKQVTLGGDLSVEEVLTAYLQPPEDEGLVSLFPDGTAFTGTKLQKGVLTLEMNEAYASLTGYARTMAAAGLTMTLTQLENVDAVQIRTPSGSLLGRASTRWTRESFLLQDTSWLYPERTVQLYFAGANGKLQAEKRAISYESPEDLPENTLQALFDGPETDQLQTPVPAGTKLLDVRVTGTLCTVVLSEEFSACDTGREAASLAVHSVVATLCALSEIEQVQLQLQSGEDLVYCSIAQPLKPEWTWYN
mgnify:CR=1 FL=1